MGAVGTTSKVGKNWTSEFIVQQLEDIFSQIILRNEMNFIVSAQLRGLLLSTVEVKDAVETNMEMSKDKLVEVMDGGDKLH